MTDTATATSLDVVSGFGDDLEPAVKRHLAAMHREARQLALTSVIPKSITHTRKKVGGTWQDVENPPGQVVATVFAVLRYGEIFNFPPAVALSKIDVIEGRIEPGYDALLALVQMAGHQTRWVEQSRELATIRVRRFEDRADPDGWQSFSFSLEDARDAGSVKDDPDDRERKSAWYTRRMDMLSSKAVKRMVRMAVPDVLITGAFGRHVDLLADDVPVSAVTADLGRLDDEVVDGEVEEHLAEPVAADGDDGIEDAVLVGEGTSAPGDAPDAAASPAGDEAAPSPTARQPVPMSDHQSRMMHVLLRQKRGAVGPDRHAVLTEILGRLIASASELTARDASTVIDLLNAEPNFQPPTTEEDQS